MPILGGMQCSCDIPVRAATRRIRIVLGRASYFHRVGCILRVAVHSYPSAVHELGLALGVVEEVAEFVRGRRRRVRRVRRIRTYLVDFGVGPVFNGDKLSCRAVPQIYILARVELIIESVPWLAESVALEDGVDVEVLYLGVVKPIHGPFDCPVDTINLCSVRTSPNARAADLLCC